MSKLKQLYVPTPTTEEYGGFKVTKEYVLMDEFERGIKTADMVSIVRCKDCKFADWDITAWWCTRNKHNPFEIGELRGYGERSHLDGFCAWGIRREHE